MWFVPLALKLFMFFLCINTTRVVISILVYKFDSKARNLCILVFVLSLMMISVDFALVKNTSDISSLLFLHILKSLCYTRVYITNTQSDVLFTFVFVSGDT